MSYAKFIKKYFKDINFKLDSLSDEEFLNLIDESLNYTNNMINLTDEEQELYVIQLSKLSKPTGVKLFEDN